MPIYANLPYACCVYAVYLSWSEAGKTFYTVDNPLISDDKTQIEHDLVQRCY